MSAPRLLAGDVACWLVKTATAPDELAPGWVPGTGAGLRRCLRPSYRLGLMAPGQRVLLWLSGARDPGVHAIGHLAAVPDAAPDAGRGAAPSVQVVLHRLQEPVTRADLRLDARFAGAEVLRMPAGSNPSHLTAAQLVAVVAHLDADVLRRAGWS